MEVLLVMIGFVVVIVLLALPTLVRGRKLDGFDDVGSSETDVEG